MARRSIVDQVEGNVKTEASKRRFLSTPSWLKICWPGIESRGTTDLMTTFSRRTRRAPATIGVPCKRHMIIHMVRDTAAVSRVLSLQRREPMRLVAGTAVPGGITFRPF